MRHHPCDRQRAADLRRRLWCRLVFAVLCAVALGGSRGQAQQAGPKAVAKDARAEGRPIQISGVFPNLTVMAKGTGSDSEAGIGALIPWAEKLWAVGYVAHIRGEGLGLYEISEDMTMRIRHAVTERLLMDVHGMFYELPAFAYGGKIWGIRPICSHLRVVPDFCYWRGLFVMASDQIDHDQGQPQSGLWFGNIDDLWSMGKPAGWGGPWWQTPVKAGTVSDPFLMTGFDNKVVHLAHESDQEVRFKIEVDFLGNGTWKQYHDILVPPNTGYIYHVFEDGFSAHWVRVTVDRDCTATVYFMYN